MSAEKRRGRGAASNPANRFETLSYHSSDWDEPEDPAPQTLFLKDDTQTIINYNDSPDVGFSASINPYRGCEHGCIYCFARPNHEYLGFSSGLDFETKILVKENAPELQPKLLKVLETQKFRRLDGTRELTVDVRLIAAT